MPRTRRLISRAVFISCGLAVAAIAAGFILGPPSYYSAKYDRSAAAAVPEGLPDPVLPEIQTEPHTCGLHSLRAVYRAYRLDPDAFDLRFRLGTDKPVNNWLPDTRGTIHPDMLRVLGQDGFETDVLFPDAAETPGRLREHLGAGHPAVVLVDAGSLHWVVGAAVEGDAMIVCDSLAREPYRVDLDAYLRDKVYSLLLVNPAP